MDDVEVELVVAEEDDNELELIGAEVGDVNELELVGV